MHRTAAPTRHATHAFTLVEMLITLVVVGLASAIVVPQMLTQGTLGVQSATRVIVADVIFAQNDAMADQAERRMTFDTDADSYRLTDNAGATINAAWKSGKVENYQVSFKEDSRFSGVDITAVNLGGDNTIAFDDVGAPDTGGTIDLRYKDHRYRVTIAEFTGRVTVAKVTGGG